MEIGRWDSRAGDGLAAAPPANQPDGAVHVVKHDQILLVAKEDVGLEQVLVEAVLVGADAGLGVHPLTREHINMVADHPQHRAPGPQGPQRPLGRQLKGVVPCQAAAGGAGVEKMVLGCGNEQTPNLSMPNSMMYVPAPARDVTFVSPGGTPWRKFTVP